MASNLKMVVEADVAKARGELEKLNKTIDGVSKQQETFNKQLKIFGGGSAVVAGIKVFNDGMKKAVQILEKNIALFRTQEQANIKLSTALRNLGTDAKFTYSELKQMASGLQGKTIFGDEVINEAQTLLLSFRSISKEQFPEILELALDLSSVLGNGINENVKKLGRAMENPVEGISVLKETGIVISDETKKQITNLTKQNKLLDAQKLLTKEISSRYGGMATAIGSLDTSSFTQLKNAWGDLGEAFGERLSMETSGIVKFLTDKVSDFTAKVSMNNALNKNENSGAFDGFSDTELFDALEKKRAELSREYDVVDVNQINLNYITQLEDEVDKLTAEINKRGSKLAASLQASAKAAADLAAKEAFYAKHDEGVANRNLSGYAGFSDELAREKTGAFLKPTKITDANGVETIGNYLSVPTPAQLVYDKQTTASSSSSGSTGKDIKADLSYALALVNQTNSAKLYSLDLADKELEKQKKIIETNIELNVYSEEQKTQAEAVLAGIEQQVKLNQDNRDKILETNKAHEEAKDFLKDNAELVVLTADEEIANLEAVKAKALEYEKVAKLTAEEKKNLEKITDEVDKQIKALEKSKKKTMSNKIDDFFNTGAFSSDKDEGIKSFVEELEGAVDNFKKKFSGITSTLQGFYSSWQALESNQHERNIRNIEEQISSMEKVYSEWLSSHDEEMSNSYSALKEQYDADAISYEDYLARKQELDAQDALAKEEQRAGLSEKEKELQKQKNDWEKKQFEAEKANQIAQAVINGAQAIMTSYGQMGLIGGSIAAALIGTITAAQVGMIASQQYVPALASGGIATSPTLSLIGEGGEPEMVLPLSKAQDFGFGNSASPSIVYNINVSGGFGTKDEVYEAVYDGISKAQRIGRIPKWKTA